VEEALHILKEFGGSATTVTIGPPQTRKRLDDALTVGADREAILCDQAFAGADTLTTVCRNETADGATTVQVPSNFEITIHS
jgi:electron transfer flavoprotein alpha/beta subunit